MESASRWRVQPHNSAAAAYCFIAAARYRWLAGRQAALSRVRGNQYSWQNSPNATRIECVGGVYVRASAAPPLLLRRLRTFAARHPHRSIPFSDSVRRLIIFRRLYSIGRKMSSIFHSTRFPLGRVFLRLLTAAWTVLSILYRLTADVNGARFSNTPCIVKSRARLWWDLALPTFETRTFKSRTPVTLTAKLWDSTSDASEVQPLC